MIMSVSKILLVMLLTLPFTQSPGQASAFTNPDNYGGKAAMRELVKNEMYYPPDALDKKIEGKVKLGFIVLVDGSTKNLEVIEGSHPLLDDEAIRLFGLILWEPALKNGEKVAADHKIEFEFKIKRYQKNVKQRGYEITNEAYNSDDALKVYPIENLSSVPKPLFDKPGLKYSDFMAQNLKYPEAAVKQNITGTVEIYFVVEPSGRVTNAKVLHGIGAGCNEEAMRLVRLIRWEPGTISGKAVRSEMTLKITFNLPGNENIRYIPASNQNQF